MVGLKSSCKRIARLADDQTAVGLDGTAVLGTLKEVSRQAGVQVDRYPGK